MNHQAIRDKFLNFFKEKNHTIVKSSRLIPETDKTLLFTNAGMVQFKDVFLGKEKKDFKRAVSCQRCLRAGGKHNDLENVGYTARHHTFFEMLGNFSFGDYFKKEAIQYAWEFLTEVVKLPPEKLWVTVYKDDKEAEDIWLNHINIKPSQFSRCGAKDNFWQMGDTGPCGPCTEIFYDHGPHIAGGPPGSAEEEGDRYVEIWNLVFMQYNRDDNGELIPLPNPCVDTGMGLERLAAVLQNVHDNFDTDLFQALSHFVITKNNTIDTNSPSIKVIADHLRASAFLITDGVRPSNEGRGYVLRRIIRRALRHGHKLAIELPFFNEGIKPLVAQMGQAYPELAENESIIKTVIEREECQFKRTINQGMQLLQHTVQHADGRFIPGDVLFKLYDTFGFPIDLTQDIAREQDFKLDLTGFEHCMQAQRKKSQQTKSFNVDYNQALNINIDTDFAGYETTKMTSKVMHLLNDKKQTVKTLKANEKGYVVLDKTPFYAEGGGQVGDVGALQGNGTLFAVTNTGKEDNIHLHQGQLNNGSLQLGDTVTCYVDDDKRASTARNHSATHLLHAALRQVLGSHVIQKGSLVAPNRLRFDFAHFSPLTDNEKETLEKIVNAKICQNTPVEVYHMSFDEAEKFGAMALFDEKYAKENVRVLKMAGDFSKELCGGTHVKATGDIGFFKITQESGIASGVRRIEAQTGEGAYHWVRTQEIERNQMAALLKATPEKTLQKLTQLVKINKELQKENTALKASLVGDSQLSNNLDIKAIGDTKIITKTVEQADMNTLRKLLDNLKSQYPKAVFILVSLNGDKIALITGVSNALTGTIDAGQLMKIMASKLDGKGGGRADMAQGGGTNRKNLPVAFNDALAFIKEKLN